MKVLLVISFALTWITEFLSKACLPTESQTEANDCEFTSGLNNLLAFGEGLNPCATDDCIWDTCQCVITDGDSRVIDTVQCASGGLAITNMMDGCVSRWGEVTDVRCGIMDPITGMCICKPENPDSLIPSGDCVGTFTSGLRNEASFPLQTGGNPCQGNLCDGSGPTGINRCLCSLQNGQYVEVNTNACLTQGAGEVFAVFTENADGTITCGLYRDPASFESLLTCSNGVVTGTFLDFQNPGVNNFVSVPNVIDIRCPTTELTCPELPPIPAAKS